MITLKKIITIIVIVFSALVVLQLYYRLTYGSVLIYVENNSFIPNLEGGSFDVDLIWNDKVLTTYTIKQNEMFPHRYVINTGFGKESLKIHRKDRDIFKEYTVYSFLVTWVIISINEDDFYITTSIFPPVLQ